MYPVLFRVGTFPIHTFGLFVALAMLVGMAIAKRHGSREGLSPVVVESLSFWAIVSSLLGARFLYTFVENGAHYWRHPLDFFAFRSGGISFLGALVFVVPTLYWVCRKKGVSYAHIVDLMSPPLALGLSIGKIGCFFAGCCYGKVCDLPWAVTFNHPETLASPVGVPLHPTQLYETLAWFLLFLVLLWIRKRRKTYGEVFLSFCVLFGIARPLLETLRGEPRMFASVSVHQVLSLAVAVAAAVVWFFVRKRSNPGPADRSHAKQKRESS